MLVLDIDGTLINKSGQISNYDHMAIERVKEAGLNVTLCTGRTTGASLKILKELRLDGAHIFFDGTLVYDPQKEIEIYSRPLPTDLVEDMIKYAIKEGLPLDLFSRTQYFVREKSWRTDLRRDFFSIKAVVADFSTIWNKEKIIKGGIAVKTPADIELAKKFALRFADKLNLTWTVTPAFPEIQFINVVNKGTSKGQALEALCGYLRIPLEQVCAIGDGPNDISLLSTSGLGIAMQNSPAELIALADYVTNDVEHSGVARAIHKLIFQEELNDLLN
jgi:5-amino-6-(5-phospho-D-ribitylamino)uracil phosphatase